MIASAFPPAGGPGVQRSLKFAKYLPTCGWHPIVWTRREVGNLPTDPTLLDDLPPEVTIRRWDCQSPTAKAMGHPVEAMGHPVEAMGRPASDSLLNRALPGIVRSEGRGPHVARLIEARLASWRARRQWPDELAEWAHSSVEPLLALIRAQRIGVLYSTYSSASNHLLALMLKRRTGLPWVADFRDLWTDDYRYREASRRRRKADRRLEQQILESADRVIGVTPAQTKILSEHVPGAADRFLTITNGFDPDDFTRACPAPTSDTPREPKPAALTTDEYPAPSAERRFVLAHVGRFDRWRTPEVLLDGLRRFADRLGDRREQVILHLVGHAGRDVRARIERCGIRATYVDYVSHGEAIRHMQAADALLLAMPDGPNAASVIPAKLFEYLATGRPILVVGPENGEAERIVRSCRAGLAVGFDEQQIAAAVVEMYEAWLTDEPIPGCAVANLAPFHRRALTQRLGAIFDQFVPRAASVGMSSIMSEAVLVS